MLVAVKPPNMLSQADRTGDTDMLTELKEYIKVKYAKPGRVYLGLVHRMDRPVGGLMVFARTSKAAARLSAQVATHEMGREYLCVVTGPVQDTFTLTDYLVKDSRLNQVEVCEADVKGAQEAILHGECIERREGTALCAHFPGDRAQPSNSRADGPRRQRPGGGTTADTATAFPASTLPCGATS